MSARRRLLSLLHAQRVEGILLVAAPEHTTNSQISRIVDAGIPVVCLDRVPDHLQLDSVSVENQDAARLGVEHLLAMGYRRIAIVTGPLALWNERKRLFGYRQALERAGTVPREDLVWHGDLRPDGVASMCRDRLAHLRPGLEAIFSTSGPTALGVLRAFRDCGLQTPDDIAFATFDELTVDQLFLPSITTIVQPSHDIGFRAAELLLRRIGGDTIEGGRVTLQLPAILKIRESSQPRRLGARQESTETQDRLSAFRR